jgi:hypothetical protein
MWKSISLFFGGIIAGFLLFMKLKDPSIVNVAGDNIESQKVKDNSKHKLSRRERRKEKRLTKNK